MTAKTSRRGILRGAALSTVAALIAVPAIADQQDPIIAWAAQLRALRAQEAALEPRIQVAEDSVNGDVAGTGWPPVDKELRALGVPPHLVIGYPVSRKELVDFNRHTESFVSGFVDWSEYQGEPAADASEETVTLLRKRQREGADRLAWWDRRQAERERNARVSGYRALVDESEALGAKICELSALICETPAIALAGALAKLEEAAIIIRNNHTRYGVLQLDDMEINETTVLGVVDDLRRLLPAGGAA